MRTFFCLIFICLCGTLVSQERKLPLEMRNAHLYSQWSLNDTITANVLLETGFPKAVINEAFAKKHLQGLVNMVEAPENVNIKPWNDARTYNVAYLIKDSLLINGEKIMIDALVADVSQQNSWKHCDIVFPLKDLKGRVEIDIAGKYMKLEDGNTPVPEGFIAYNVGSDSNTKGMYITTTLLAYDTLGKSEALKGNFLLDLGAGGAIFLNKNREEVVDFVSRADRMVLKDTTRFKPDARTELSVIIPKRIQLDNIDLKGSFIAAMKIYASATSGHYVGMVGNPFFANFVIAFDFEKNKFYLKPNSDKVKIVE